MILKYLVICCKTTAAQEDGLMASDSVASDLQQNLASFYQKGHTKAWIMEKYIFSEDVPQFKWQATVENSHKPDLLRWNGLITASEVAALFGGLVFLFCVSSWSLVSLVSLWIILECQLSQSIFSPSHSGQRLSDKRNAVKGLARG